MPHHEIPVTGVDRALPASGCRPPPRNRGVGLAPDDAARLRPQEIPHLRLRHLTPGTAGNSSPIHRKLGKEVLRLLVDAINQFMKPDRTPSWRGSCPLIGEQQRKHQRDRLRVISRLAAAFRPRTTAISRAEQMKARIATTSTQHHVSPDAKADATRRCGRSA